MDARNPGRWRKFLKSRAVSWTRVGLRLKLRHPRIRWTRAAGPSNLQRVPCMSRRFTRRGFSLVELIVVLAIMTLLAGVVTPVLSGQVDKADRARAQSDLGVLAGAFTQYRSDTGVWPANTAATTVTTKVEALASFTCLFANAWSKGGWDGPYLSNGAVVTGTTVQLADAATDKGFVDPWGNAFQVDWFASGYSGSSGAIAFVCAGPDGVVGTTPAGAFTGTAAGDDLVLVVTRKL
jgi:type II secretion system protein G